MRYITLMDGTGMGDSLLIFQTDAPQGVLKELERVSCEVYLNHGDYEDVPIWSEVLEAKGYTFECVGSHQHVTPYGTSGSWLKEHELADQIQEHYVIENQP